MTKVLVAAGGFITLLSLSLAYSFHYNHFFEFLLLGLLLLLIPTISAELRSRGKIILLYVVFLMGGLAVEFSGLRLAHAWHYNYDSLVEYILLFAWAYPAGGFIIVLSYLYGRKVFGAKETPATEVRQNPVRIAKVICIASTILTLYFFANLHSRFSIVLGSYSFLLVVCAMLSIISERRSHSSFVRDFLQNWRATLVAALSATYVFMLIQELPNIAAKQWAYTWQTSTILDSLFLGIPLATWLLWPFLVFGTVAVLYATRK
ncbi:MAG: hypothetical protein G01um10148_1039 [Parcubacteria group bacterium Gr01-1014_8]|nr:MAG: hypothetical protein G01um10148_1039 [Parcubacteria group bacterium Gr01-1014_8]